MVDLRSHLRIEETADELDVLRSEIEAWLAAVRADDLLEAYVSHWAALEAVLLPGLEKARAEVPVADTGLPSGEVYAACRRADLRTVFLRRLWRWYADRVDQRRGNGEVVERTMEAADELVWSCWAPTFTAAGVVPPPPPPMPFVDHRFTATATPRVTVPADLAAARDEMLAAQVSRLPVPVIGLPAVVLRRPWWLILLAHETGHHVQYDLGADPDLVTAVAGAVTTAASSAGAGDDEAALWAGWSRELFADAYSAAMVGLAAVWAVVELEHRPPAGLIRSPAGTYPPPLVRLAVLRAVLAGLGAPADPPLPPDAAVLKEVAAPPSDALVTAVAGQLERAEAVASALLHVPLGGATLASLGGALPSWYATAPRAAQVWADELRAGAAMARQDPESARQCAAGGVLAWTRLGSASTKPAEVEDLAEQLRDTLRQCRPIGTRAGKPPIGAAVAEARDRLLDALDDPALGEEPGS